MYAIQFNDGQHCDAYFPFGVRISFKIKGVPDCDLLLSKRKCTAFLIYELHAHQLGILQAIVDTPERCVQKGVMSQNGFYGCHTCTTKADRVKTHNEKGSVTVWLPKYVGKGKARKIKPCLLRSQEKTLQVLRKRVAGPRPTADNAYHYFVKGNFFRSAFELAPEFDLENGFALEDFHMVGGGAVKRIIDTLLNPYSAVSQFQIAKSRLWKENEVSD